MYSLYHTLDFNGLFTACYKLVPLNVITVILSPPKPLVPTVLLSSTGLTFLDSKYKCYHTMLVFLCLISLDAMYSGSTHVTENGRISSFLMAK